ncbi:MAG TPA: hypothetical protein VFZ66_27925 [Herpetosiphonaceae bacterium]
MTTEIWAPGHRYTERTKTGIEVTETRIRLHARPPDGGESRVIAEVPRPPHLTEWACWYDLQFADLFPQVAYWWFGDAWTGQVKVSRAAGTTDARTLVGYVQFTDDETPGEPWLLVDADPLIVSVPLPEHHRQPLNLPLQLAIARLVFAALSDPRYADQWLPITSLVARADLAASFPTTRAALTAELPLIADLLDLAPGRTPDLDLDAPATRVFRLEEREIPLREVLCMLQGVKRPA